MGSACTTPESQLTVPPSPPQKAEKPQKTEAARTHSAYFISRLLDVVEQDIVPKTAAAVEDGNRLFGAAIMRKNDLSCVCADTNKATEWPLLHGEVSCLRTFNGLPAEQKTPAKDCFFVATHEPCSLCLSAITWSGYDTFYHLFSYEDTRDAFGIPDDIKILEEVFKCDKGHYARSNAYWSCHSVAKLVDALPEESERRALQRRMSGLRVRYNQLSRVCQASTASKAIPL